MSDQDRKEDTVNVENKVEDLDANLKEIYDIVSEKVNLVVSNGDFTSDHIKILILDIVGVVQNYTSGRYDNIEGSQKKEMALNVLRHVIDDFYSKGKISKDDYDMIILGLTFFGDALIDLGKASWKKLTEIEEDVIEHGCNGCWGRNCRRKKN